MANSIINIGTLANDGTGDDLREAFIKVNNNFSKKNTGVVRGHILDRRERAKKLFENNNDYRIGPIASSNYSSASILTIPWSYIAMLGGIGLSKATKIAILNANYLKASTGINYGDSIGEVSRKVINSTNKISGFVVEKNDINAFSEKIINYYLCNFCRRHLRRSCDDVHCAYWLPALAVDNCIETSYGSGAARKRSHFSHGNG